MRSSIDDELNLAVCALSDAEIASGREAGLQIVCYYRGKKIVDCWAGQGITPQTSFLQMGQRMFIL